MADYFEPYIDADGIHVPTYSEILQYLIDRYKAIFGEDVYLGEETPDYQLLSVFAKCVNDYSALAVEAYNARDPYYASANSLDMLVMLGGLTRKQATHSTAVLKLVGEDGTIIPKQSKAIDQNGNLWEIASAVTIPAAGYATVNSTCTTAGAVKALAGTISGIYTPTPGWTAVTNEADAVSGRNTETDAELRTRFSLTHNKTDNGSLDAIVSGIASVDGVTFVDVVQNDTGSTDSDGIPAHSFCAVVDGGDDDKVAEMILAKKSPGVGTYGGVGAGAKDITVVDAYGHENHIKFARPSSIEVSVTVTISTISGMYDSSRVDDIIKEAIVYDITNLGIGKPWNVTMGYKDIYQAFSSDDLSFSITSITATAGGTTTSTTVPCSFNEILTTAKANITVDS